MNLNNLMKLYDNDLFDDIRLPDGIDKVTLVNTILSECALNTPMYPEHDLLKMMINNFFNQYYDNFERCYRALMVEYNPNENFHKEDTRDITDKVNRVENVNGRQTENLNENTTNEDFRMAFDANDYKRTDKSTGSTSNNNSFNRNDTTTNDRNRTGKVVTSSHGLTGVYTNQRLIKEEIELRRNFNIYKYITSLFYDEFMLKCM